MPFDSPNAGRLSASWLVRQLRSLRIASGNALGRRVIAWMLLSSLCLALLATGAQMLAIHHRDVTQIERSLDDLEHSSMTGLAFAVWNLNQAQIDSQLAGLRALPDVSYVAVHDEQGRLVSSAGASPPDAVTRRFPIFIGQPTGHGTKTARFRIGELTVQATLAGVYGRMGSEAAMVLAGQACETFFGAFVMLLIFHHLVSRPLSALARASRKLDAGHLAEAIELRRTRGAQDDFDTLVAAMNAMRMSLKRDFDEIQGARDALSTSEARYRRLVESTNVVAWELDARTGRMTFISQQVTQLLGDEGIDWSAEGFSGRMVDEADLPTLREALLATETPHFELECRLVTAGGLRRWVAILADGHADSSGRFFWQGHLVDIDARKRNELELARYRAELEGRVEARTAELRDKVLELERQRERQAALIGDLETARNQAIQAEKLASIGQLAAGVAHEINNPVGFVLSNFTSLERYVNDIFRLIAAYEGIEPLVPAGAPQLATLSRSKECADLEFVRDDVVQLLAESRDGLDRVRRIVQDLKDFARAGETSWQVADLIRGFESTLNVVRNEIKYKADVVRRFQPLPEVDCVPSQLNQVFMNLLVNAAQAIDGQGTITVSSGVQGEDVWIEVADTGCGMPPEVVKRIFDPFFTTKPVGQGTGLGLSVSYSIVRRHGGRLEVSSTPGVGTAFKVWLPIRQPEGAAFEPTS